MVKMLGNTLKIIERLWVQARESLSHSTMNQSIIVAALCLLLSRVWRGRRLGTHFSLWWGKCFRWQSSPRYETERQREKPTYCLCRKRNTVKPKKMKSWRKMKRKRKKRKLLNQEKWKEKLKDWRMKRRRNREREQGPNENCEHWTSHSQGSSAHAFRLSCFFPVSINPCSLFLWFFSFAFLIGVPFSLFFLFLLQRLTQSHSFFRFCFISFIQCGMLELVPVIAIHSFQFSFSSCFSFAGQNKTPSPFSWSVSFHSIEVTIGWCCNVFCCWTKNSRIDELSLVDSAGELSICAWSLSSFFVHYHGWHGMCWWQHDLLCKFVFFLLFFFSFCDLHPPVLPSLFSFLTCLLCLFFSSSHDLHLSSFLPVAFLSFSVCRIFW